MHNESPKDLLETIISPIRNDLQAVREVMRSNLSTDVALVDQIVQHALLNFGKQIRPTLLLLVCHALGGNQTSAPISLAASVELIHTATLLHDDVVDESELRRGEETANVVFGNAASVLVGDFLYTRAFQMMLHGKNVGVLEEMANATNQIAEGEVMQLCALGDYGLTEERYFELIRRKTGVLFAAAAAVGAQLSRRADLRDVAYRIGDCIGIAFQLIDDLLDYLGSAQELGKNAGDDTRGGRVTLPMILALQGLPAEQKQALQNQIKTDAASAFVRLKQLIHELGVDETVKQRAAKLVGEARQLLEQFPDNQYRTALLALCAFSLVRRA